MLVPFLDIASQDQELKSEILRSFEKIINTTSFVYGRDLIEFESAFAQKLRVKHCIGVSNGTDALTIALKCLGIKPGDEVITAANTFIATAEAISNVGATPVFVDHDEYFCMDVHKIEEKITPQTKAIIPVHLYGQSADMDAINRICKQYNLILLEDCAQSHFAHYKEKYTGTFGEAAAFSFYPGKNLGAYGDAGCIVTNDDRLANDIRMYCNHGSPAKHQHTVVGINSRMDSIQAAVLSVKLKHIDEWNRLRFNAALYYNKGLANCSFVKTPLLRQNADHIFHLYVVLVENRDALQKHLFDKNIHTGIHYYTALPFLPCYQFLNYTEKDFPVSAYNQSRLLSLPMFPGITPEQQNYVIDSVLEFYS